MKQGRSKVLAAYRPPTGSRLALDYTSPLLLLAISIGLYLSVLDKRFWSSDQQAFHIDSAKRGCVCRFTCTCLISRYRKLIHYPKIPGNFSGWLRVPR